MIRYFLLTLSEPLIGLVYTLMTIKELVACLIYFILVSNELIDNTSEILRNVKKNKGWNNL